MKTRVETQSFVDHPDRGEVDIVITWEYYHSGSSAPWDPSEATWIEAVYDDHSHEHGQPVPAEIEISDEQLDALQEEAEIAGYEKLRDEHAY